MDKKRCPRCHRWLDATTQNFPKDSSAKDGLRGYCRACEKDLYPIRHDAFIARAKDEMRDPHDSRHGTNRGYNYGCKCTRCKEAHRVYVARCREKVVM